MEKQENRKIKIAFFFSIVFIALTNTTYYWQKLAGLVFPIVGSIIAMLFISISIKIIIALVGIFKQRKNLSIKLFIPLMIYVTAIVEGVFNPFNINAEKFQSKVLIRACYEGTMNTTTIKFRENKTFEFQAIGWFAISDFWQGTWKSEGDTLYLSFDGLKPSRIGNTLVVKNDSLITIRKDGDGLENVIEFSLGYCKGLN